MPTLEYKIKELNVIHKVTQGVKFLYIYNFIITIEHILYFTFKHKSNDNISVYIYFYLNDGEYYINIFRNQEYLGVIIVDNIDSVVESLNNYFSDFNI